MRVNSKSRTSLKSLIIVIIAILLITSIRQLLLKKQDFLSVATYLENEIEVEIKDVDEDTIEVSSVYNRKIDNTTSRSSSLDRELAIQEEIDIEEVKRQIEENKYVEPINTTKYITIDQVRISRDMDLTQRCGISKEDFKTLMNNLRTDSSGFFKTNSDTIYDVCEKYSINEIFFCGLIAGESGWNISGNHRRTNNYISMMSGGRLISFSSPAEGLEAAAKLLHTKYLSEGGQFYCGKTLAGVKKRFCPASSTWTNLIYTCMSKIV